MTTAPATETRARSSANSTRTVNHSPAGKRAGVPEPVAVVELPRGETVADGRVLDRVGVADLVRPHEERLVVRVVGDAPGDAVERALRRHGEVGFEHPVAQRHLVRADEHPRPRKPHGGAAGELCADRRERAPVPCVGLKRVDRLHQRQMSAVAARRTAAVRPVGFTPAAAGRVRGSSPVSPV